MCPHNWLFCLCGAPEESLAHLLFECTLLHVERELLSQELRGLTLPKLMEEPVELAAFLKNIRGEHKGVSMGAPWSGESVMVIFTPRILVYVS